jgi:cob(I)alamin adenosyltransferase
MPTKRKPTKVITKVHTGTGSGGATDLSGHRIAKHEYIIQLIGDLDEACAALGYCLHAQCRMAQETLFVIGAAIHSTDPDTQLLAHNWLDGWDEQAREWLDQPRDPVPLEGFLVPTPNTAPEMQARSIIRRAERSAWKAERGRKYAPYLNLMSDVIFMVAWERADHDDPQWTGIAPLTLNTPYSE